MILPAVVGLLVAIVLNILSRRERRKLKRGQEAETRKWRTLSILFWLVITLSAGYVEILFWRVK